MKGKPDILVVIDEPFIYGRNPAYQVGQTVKVPIESIVARIATPLSGPSIRVTLTGGAIVDLLRIDGSTVPLCVQVESDEDSNLYEVTHSSWKLKSE